MKFLSLITFAASFVSLSFVQGIDIGAPADGAIVMPGQNITVEVDRPNSLTGSEEVAVVISIAPCETASCISPDQGNNLGSILYNGPYNPQYDSIQPWDHKPPYQNFSVQVPSWFTSGESIALIVTHVSLVGAGPWLFLEYKNISLTVY